jgi:hypothetical protein
MTTNDYHFSPTEMNNQNYIFSVYVLSPKQLSISAENPIKRDKIKYAFMVVD